MKVLLSIIFSLVLNIILAQNYSTIKVKEEYDLFNSLKTQDYNPCGIDPNSDQEAFGEGMAYFLEGYINMYKTTGDKAYLYKFLIQSLCIIENRHDNSGVNTEPRWADQPYLDGNIIGSLAHFVHFIKLEESSLQNLQIYPFSEITSSPFSANFDTFGEYAHWLGYRVDETLNWYLISGYWSNTYGIKKNTNDQYADAINKQIGFARALLFMGLSNPNYLHLQKANRIVSLFKGNVNFVDPCEDISYNEPMLRLNNVNAYWWYHAGWKVKDRNCSYWDWSTFRFYYGRFPEYDAFTEFIEDISHGSLVAIMALEYYNYQPSSFNSQFTETDMVRFRNTFAKNIYDDNGGFYNSVAGSDNPIYTASGCTNCPHNMFKISALNYMPFQRFDNVGSPTNIYQIIMDFYAANIANSTGLPNSYCCEMNNGHAEVVKAQWEHECVNLSLYNRNVVYDQDFYVKNTLTVEPETPHNISNSYAEPIIYTPTFTIDPTVNTDFYAGESIIFKSGTHFLPKTGNGQVHIYIEEGACTDGMRPTVSSSENNNEPNRVKALSKNTFVDINKTETQRIVLYPNPTENQLTIVLENDINNENFDFYIYNFSGTLVRSGVSNERSKIDLNLSSGMYLVKVKSEELWYTEKLIIK